MKNHVELHFAKHPLEAGPYPEPRPPIVCKDGYSLSVQASAYHYCTPRNNGGKYETVEVWIKDQSGEWITEEPSGCMSIENVNLFIENHGGPAA